MRVDGRSITVDAPIPDLRGSRLDDRASSVSVRGGTWQLCTEPHFTGACVTDTPGDYASLRGTGLNNSVSSARLLAAPAERIAGTAPVVLFEGTQFSGRTLAVDGGASSLEHFNDRARSMIVYDGQWELCEHDRFRGQCTVYGPGRHANLGVLAGDLSSLRPIDAYAAPPSAGPARVVLYEGTNFRGRALMMDQELVANMQQAGFDDRAASLRVERGDWVMCTDRNFQGRCWTFGPGDYPVLPDALQDNVSSARRVQGNDPFDTAPDWRRR